MACVASTDARLGAGADVTASGFDLDLAWQRDARVSLRPEPFGALVYHFGTRRLSFLKDVRLRTVVSTIEDFSTARAACLAAGVAAAELPVFQAALARLADGSMLHPAKESR
jgi:mycofactocin biosynthesis protein MftB